MIRTVCAALAAACLSLPAFALQAETPEPRVYESRGQVSIDGQRIRYSVTAGETYLEDNEGNPVASIFSTAYIADGMTDPRTRPVAFVFNGGPPYQRSRRGK